MVESLAIINADMVKEGLDSIDRSNQRCYDSGKGSNNLLKRKIRDFTKSSLKLLLTTIALFAVFIETAFSNTLPLDQMDRLALLDLYQLSQIVTTGDSNSLT
jgi:transcription-repair coupling factor (superfamily II helicase)